MSIPLSDGSIILPGIEEIREEMTAASLTVCDLRSRGSEFPSRTSTNNSSNNFLYNLKDKGTPPRARKLDEHQAYVEYAAEHGIHLPPPENDRCTQHFRVFRREKDKKIVAVPIPCKDRYCPHCCNIRERSRREIVKKRCFQMVKSTGKVNLKFLTLTIRNKSVHGDLEILHAAMRNMIRSKFGRKYIKRGAWVIEWTMHPGKRTPHLHVHAVVESSYFKIPFDRLLREWKRVTKKQGKFVRVTALKGKWNTVAEYMSKYMIKDDWIHPAWRTLSNLFKGKQLMGIWGKFTGDRSDDSEYTFLGSTLQWVEIRSRDLEHEIYIDKIIIPLAEFIERALQS